MAASAEKFTDSILVVDDYEVNRDLLLRRLTIEGYETLGAENGEQALALIAKREFDLILLDVMMPGIDGFDVLATVRQDHTLAELPVILVTARDDSEDVVRGLELGANDYVTKPIDMSVLLARVATQLTLRRLKKERDELTKLKDEFLSIATHELKTPLTKVLGFSVLAAKKIPPGTMMDDRTHSMIRRIRDGARQMHKIVEEFLDLQAMEEGQLQLVKKMLDLNELAGQSAQSNEEYAKSRQLELNCEFDPNLPPVLADEDRIAQVVENLLDEAIRFGPPSTAIQLKTCAKGECVVVEISDCGPCLGEEEMMKVFTKFSELHRQAAGGEKGAGWGMAICKELVESHGGEIGVTNNPGQGTTFWFTLPLEGASEGASADASS